MKDMAKHVAVEGGSYRLAIQNIVCHLDVLLTDAEKAAINWHPEQSVSLAVMRVIAHFQTALYEEALAAPERSVPTEKA